MKRKIVYALLLVLLISWSASGQCVVEPFTSQSFSGWTLTPKSGSIVQTDRDTVQITVPYLPQTEPDAYLQLETAADGTQGFAVGVEMRIFSTEGNCQMVLRDSSSELEGHYISIALLEAGKLYYLPDLLGRKVWEEVDQQETCRLQAAYKPEIDGITVFRDGEEKARIEKISENDAGRWGNFRWNEFRVRLQATRQGETEVQAEFDNFFLHHRGEGDVCFSTRGLELSGETIQSNILWANLKNTPIRTQAVLAHYRDGSLRGIQLGQAVETEAYGVGTQTIRYEPKNLHNKDTVKLFLWEDVPSMRPVAKPIFYLIGSSDEAVADVPDVVDLAVLFRNQHPRVIADRAQFAGARETIETNPASNQARWYAAIKARARQSLNAALPTYEDTDSLRLTASGTVLDRVRDMAFVYQMEDDETYAEKVWEYIELCASWPDWGDNHFLNTADLCAAFAIAYDWIYDGWSAEQREFLAETLIEKGLSVANEDYDTNAWWTTLDSNWTAVCNAGVAMGAVALMGDYSESEEILVKALENVRQCYIQFLPDGGWYEGVAYWNYATGFWTMMMSTMEAAFGTDFGHHLTPGLEQSIRFPLYMSGSNGIFNFGDASEELPSFTGLFYFGNQFADKAVNGYRLDQLNNQKKRPEVVDVLWYDKMKIGPVKNLDNVRYYQGIETVVLRDGVAADTKSAAVLHGGKTDISHGHCDAGQFFYEAQGVRWAIDLGAENYNLYQAMNDRNEEKSKWSYYRYRAEGHNTWVINPDSGMDQEMAASAVIEKVGEGTETAFAIADLSSAYTTDAESVKRGLYLDRSSQSLLIRDELHLKAPSELYWFMHTRADVTLSEDKKSAILTQSDDGGTLRRLWVGLVAGDGEFQVMDAKPLPTSPDPDSWPENQDNLGDATNPKTQNSNAGVSKLAVHYIDSPLQVKQAVYMIPLEEGQEEPEEIPDYGDLDTWK